MNGARLSGDEKGLQNLSSGSIPPRASIDYKQEYIKLKKALTNLKRGNPSDIDLEILGCSVDDFYSMSQSMVAHNFEVKDREKFLKRLEKVGINLFDLGWLKMELDETRKELLINPDDEFLKAKEIIYGNIIFGQF